jgi:hypothetical protein
LDHVVRINGGSTFAEPIVLHLLPGEETRLGLKVVNQGQPSSISVEASGPIVEAVRPLKKENYIAGEEMVQVSVRMPDVERLEGELLLTGGGGNGSVPITLIRDSKGNMDNPGLEERMEFIDEESDEGSEEEEGEERAEGEDAEDLEDSDNSAEEEDLSHIKFSKEKDLERYNATRRRDTPVDYGDSGNGGHAKEASSYEHGNFAEDEEAPQDSNKRTISSLFELGSDKSTLLAVPAAMLIALIALLVLTFYSESIPEFTGALASAMLIITLIIYGAATLLKA